MYRDIFLNANYIYDLEALPDEYAKKEWLAYRIAKGDTVAVPEKVKIVHPHMSVRPSVCEAVRTG